MISLLLAILSSMLVSVLMRASEGRAKNKFTMLVFNYVACSCAAGWFLFSAGVPVSGTSLPYTLGFGTLSGAFYLASFLLLQWNIHRNGVTLPSLFMKLGVLVPILLTTVFFHELPTMLQVIGIVLAIAAILLINLEKGTGKASSSLGLVALLLCGGTADAMSKVYEETGAPELRDLFLFMTFFSAMLFCIVLCIVKKQKVALADIGLGLLIGIPNYFSSRFLLLSLQSIPAVVAYPTFSVATIVLVTLAGMVFFKERLSKRQLIALGIILLALALLNL